MRYTMEAVLNGNEKLFEYYAAAREKWAELFAKDVDDAAWIEWVGEQQRGHFEKECGGHLLGHEVMAWSAFAMLYSTQFGWQAAQRASAQKLVKAINASTCADDVKQAVAKAAASYGLDGDKAA